MKHVGITQRVDVVPDYGERRDALDQAWTPLVEDLDALPVPLPNRSRHPGRIVDDLDLDAIVLSGGNDLEATGGDSVAEERDAFERALLEAARQRSVPVLGVCRGLQVLAVEHGATLAREADHAGTRHEVEPTTQAPEVLDLPREVNSFHDWTVPTDEFPEELLVLGRAPDGTVEALAHRTQPLVGIMWHPERERPPHAADRRLLGRLLEGQPPW